MHPYLFHYGHFSLPTFGVLAACGLMGGLWLSQYTAGVVGVDAEKLWDAGLFAVMAAFVLSRVLLAATHFREFVSYPVLLLAVPSLTPWGLVFTAIATYGWLEWKGLPLLRVLDAWAPCGTLVWMFLALGHYAEGSDPGMAGAGREMALYPVALYAAGVGLGITAGLVYLLPRLRGAGATAGAGLLAVGLGQFGLSFWRQPGVGEGLDALQYVALGMLVAGCALLAHR